MMAYMEGEEPSIEDIKRCIREGTRTLQFFPTYCGSAFKNKGIQLVLDAVVDYLPSPTEVDPQDLTDEEGNPTGEKALVSTDEPFRALAFKIMDDRFGALTFIRVYSGKLKKGDTILNSATGKTERVGRMVEMHANDRNEIDSAQSGRYLRLCGHEERANGAYPVQHRQALYPRGHGLPGACYLNCGRSRKTRRDTREDGCRDRQDDCRKTLRSVSRPTKRRVKPSSRAWVNCTWTSRSTF